MAIAPGIGVIILLCLVGEALVKLGWWAGTWVGYGYLLVTNGLDDNCHAVRTFRLHHLQKEFPKLNLSVFERDSNLIKQSTTYRCAHREHAVECIVIAHKVNSSVDELHQKIEILKKQTQEGLMNQF